MASYRKVMIYETGGPEVLQLVDMPITEPAPHAVRVKVQAAGVAYGDVIGREGVGTVQLPDTPGYDLVGVVDAVGEDVTTLQVGQRIAALIGAGGYTEMATLPAADCVPIPDHLDAAEAVSLVLNGLTAYQMLHRVAHVDAGERMLVHGAGGGVGVLLLQLGKLANLEVYGTASASKHADLQPYGATLIDYRREDFASQLQNSMDAVFDGIGGDYWARSYQTLRAGGRLVVYGRLAVMDQGRRNDERIAEFKTHMPTFSPLDLFAEGKAVMGYYVTLFKAIHPAWYVADLQALFDLLAADKLAAPIGARVPFEEVAHAHHLINESKVIGKIVLMMA